MTGLLRRTLGLALTLGLCVGLRPAAAEVPIMPLDDVKVGMKGYGLTVFQGSKIEPFDVTVIGILEGFDFQMDMILIRIDSGPVVTRNYGIVAGMSGSPIYLEGRMIGALAYGWEFQKEPIAGVTPIGQMLLQYDPNHPLARATAARREMKKRAQAEKEARDAAPAKDTPNSPNIPSTNAPKPNQRTELPAPLKLEGSLRVKDRPVKVAGRPYQEILVAPNEAQADRLAAARPDAGILKPVATPVFCRGVGGAGLQVLQKLLAPYNLVPMQVGGAKVPDNVAVDFSPGAAIAVSLTYGDIELTGIGTMTYRDGDTVLAFGHPMMGFGKVDMPMATAYISAVINSAQSSNKLGGAVQRIGRISQDRPTCIGGRIGPMADVLPIHYSLTDRQRNARRDFDLKLVRQPGLSDLYTAVLMQMAMQNVAGSYFDGVTTTHIEIGTRVQQNGKRLTIERNNSFDSKALSSFGMNPLFDLFMTLTLLRQNPYGEAQVEDVKVDLQFEASRRFANIERANPSRLAARPGQPLDVTLYLRPYGGEERPLTIPVKVPANAEPGPMLIVLIGGNDAYALRSRLNPPAQPVDVPTLVTWLNNNSTRNDSVVVETILPTSGLEMAGHQLHDLPDPFVEPLYTSSVDGMREIHDVDEHILPTNEVIAGVAAVVVEVVSEEGKHGEGKVDYGGLQSPQMSQPEAPQQMQALEQSAERTLQALTGEDLPGPELSWALRPPRAASITPEDLQRLIDHAWRSWQQRRAEGPSGFVTVSFARAVSEAVATGTDEPKADADKDKAEPDTSKKGDDETPDVTGELELKKPPKMPGWSELDELQKGKLVTGDSEAKEGEEKTSTDDEEGKPVARPTATWSLYTADAYKDGQFTGTYLSDDGRVGMAPDTKVLARPDAERIWSLLPRPDGSVVVGSWAPEAKLYRVTPDGKSEMWFKTKDAALQALAPLADGTFVAAGVPGGTIYRITGRCEGGVFATLDEPYIWALVPDGQGGLYAGTGNRGRVYHLDAKGNAKLVLESKDRHVLALAVGPKGDIYAGTYPQGRVYRITGDQATSIYQSPGGAVLSLAATPNGNLYLGTAGAGKIYRLDPSGAAKELAGVENGNVYSLTNIGNDVYAASSRPGQLVKIDDQDVESHLYTSDEPFMLSIAAQNDHSLVGTIAGSGEVVQLTLDNARRGEYLSPIHDAEMVARWGVMRWRTDCTNGSQVTFETRSGNTATPDKGWSPWSPRLVEQGGSRITSPPARYLQFRAVFEGTDHARCRLDRVDLFYKTVNRPPTVEVKAPEAGSVVHKKVKIKWQAEDPDDDDLHFEVYYAPVGTTDWKKIEAPVDEDSSDSTSADTDKSDKKSDADKDKDTDSKDAKDDASGDTTASLHRTGSPTYVFARFGLRQAPPGAPKPDKPVEVKPKTETATGTTPKPKTETKKSEKPKESKKLVDDSVTWDTSEVPDGQYVVRVVALDDVANPDDPKSAEALSRPFRIVNTGPVLLGAEAGKGAPPAELVFTSEGTYLSSAEYRWDDGEWKALVPTDGLFDEPTEHIKTPEAPKEPGEHKLTIRVRDAAENVSRFEWTIGSGTAAPAEKPKAEGKPAPKSGDKAKGSAASGFTGKQGKTGAK